MREVLKKRLLIIAGTLAVVIGIIGIFVPVLPTTPFLLLAAACFLRGSDRWYRWLLGNRLFGAYIRNYIEGRGMPRRMKAVTLILLWGTIGLSAAFAVEHPALRIFLLLVAVGVTVHIVMIGRKRDGHRRC